MIEIRITNQRELAAREKGEFLIDVAAFFGTDVEGNVDAEIVARLRAALAANGVNADVQLYSRGCIRVEAFGIKGALLEGRIAAKIRSELAKQGVDAYVRRR